MIDLLQERDHLIILTYDIGHSGTINVAKIKQTLASIDRGNLLVTTYNGDMPSTKLPPHELFNDASSELDDHMERLSMWLHVYENENGIYHKKITFINMSHTDPTQFNLNNVTRREDEIGVIEDSSRNENEMHYVLKHILIGNSVVVKNALVMANIGMKEKIKTRSYKTKEDFTFPMSLARCGLHMVIINE